MAFDPTLPLNNSQVASAELRAQFTGLKVLIDALRSELDSIPPGPASIDDLQAADPGTITITAIANRAMEIVIWRKGPSDPDLQPVATVPPGIPFEQTGLESGVHSVKVIGLNGGGYGPESPTVDVAVI